MTSSQLESYRQQVVEAAGSLVRSGILTRSNHGNLSVRVPDTETFLLSAGGGLAGMRAEKIALFDLDGTLREGTVEPVGAEIVQMHAVVYRLRPEFASVVHTHSPHATGFAAAGRAIPLAYEPLARFGMDDGVPVAAYGPRGSPQSVQNIATVLQATRRIRGLLLENHGVLTFSDTLAGAVRANMVIEEAAEIIANAYAVGGPKVIPPHLAEATQQRQEAFQAAGSHSAKAKAARR
jgi:L-fuculose-phosphate aldolase